MMPVSLRASRHNDAVVNVAIGGNVVEVFFRETFFHDASLAKPPMTHSPPPSRILPKKKTH
jgi:hypothetical protein